MLCELWSYLTIGKWPEAITIRNQEKLLGVGCLTREFYRKAPYTRRRIYLFGFIKPPHHPKSDGLIERHNRKLNKYFSLFISNEIGTS